MSKRDKKGKYEKFNYYFLIVIMVLFPIIDVINSLLTRNFDITISIGMVVKGIFIAYLFYYFLFKVKRSKEKKLFLAYISLLIVWFAFFIGNRIGLLSINNIFNECVYVFKYYYSVIILGLLYFFCKGNRFDKKQIKMLLLVSFITYVTLLFIPYITGTAFNSYKDRWTQGKVGWFYAANEIGMIMLFLFFYFVNEALEYKRKYFVLLLIGCFVILEIGTKISLFGLFIILSYYLVRSLLKLQVSNIVYLLLIVAFSGLVVVEGAAKQNISLLMKRIDNNIAEKVDESVNNVDNDTEEPEEEITEPVEDDSVEEENPKEPQKNTIVFDTMVNGRWGLFQDTYSIYTKAPLLDKVVGIGFTNTSEINDERIEKLVEIDFFDIVLHFGIIGFILFMMPYIYFLIVILNRIIRQRIFTWDILGYMFVIGLTIGVATMAGHVFSAPAVSIFLAINILLLYQCVFNQGVKNDKKIME